MLEQVFWQDLWPHRELTLEQSVPEGLYPMERTHARAVHEELQPMGRTHTGEVHEGLSPVGRAYGDSLRQSGKVMVRLAPGKAFLQAKQSQLPQPLLIRLVLQTLHQLRCPSLDTLQHLNVSLVVGGPKLNTGFEVRPHQYQHYVMTQICQQCTWRDRRGEGRAYSKGNWTASERNILTLEHLKRWPSTEHWTPMAIFLAILALLEAWPEIDDGAVVTPQAVETAIRADRSRAFPSASACHLKNRDSRLKSHLWARHSGQGQRHSRQGQRHSRQG
ncbi:hypothetical protein QYF61_006736 [Mycteria americana]|uniref:Uncharacterized protein n=1 Tax=Mycteria americana TaxID=33587 RepID=A0AAN7NL07_MYCAM|nr:hypothetical protein QYF61_006736 [Mycteria americana]